jgi:hypothetical protein
MRSFRPGYRFTTPAGKPGVWSATEIHLLLDGCFAPGHFFLSAGANLAWEHKEEEISWEIFQGRLLEPAHSRVTQVFEAWNAFWLEQGSRSAEPILSLKLDYPRRQIHVVRAIHCYAWEAYDAGENVILSRETTRWVRERVSTISLNDFESGTELHDEIVCQLFQAVVGSSRLPLTSLEAPLPAYTLGQMAYFFQSSVEQNAGPLRSPDELICRSLTQDLAPREKVKLLETILRATSKEQLSETAALFVARWMEIGSEVGDLVALFLNLFEEISLSPYTDFVDQTLRFIEHLEQQGVWTREDRVDFLSWLLRHLGRHLTAYDLVTFHHRGANYPDALLLDAVLKTYLRLMEDRPDLFVSTETDTNQGRKRMRRRALRQSWLLWRWYQGHPVPQVSTSPGENARVLPPAYPRVPEEEILQPDRRRHRLFENDELDSHWNEPAETVLRQSIRDLDHPEELQELGMALFLDRPLGVCKNPGELDQTPLLSYEAFSRSVAVRRLRFLADKSGLLAPDQRIALERLHDLKVEGFSPSPGAEPARPGSVSISDALKASPDFVILRTTKKSADDFVGCFQFEVLPSCFHLGHWERGTFDDWPGGAPKLVVPETGKGSPGGLSIYDGKGVKRLELSIDLSQGYQCRAGLELPRAGMRLLRAWREDGRPMELPAFSIPIR